MNQESLNTSKKISKYQNTEVSVSGIILDFNASQTPEQTLSEQLAEIKSSLTFNYFRQNWRMPQTIICGFRNDN